MNRMPLKVHLFIPCFIEQLFPRSGMAMVNILERLGCELEFPASQTCCGQPAFNSGYWNETLPLARRLLNIFEKAEYVVSPSGSCVSMVRHMYDKLNFSDSEKERWQTWRNRVFEFSEFLSKILKIEQWQGTFLGKVTYHDACHGLRELGIQEYPRQLLKSIQGIEYVEMARADTCCGFGGTFSVNYPEISIAMLENKVRWIQDSGAKYVVASDISCLMHLEGYLKKYQHPIQTLHLSELLWQACQHP